MSFTDKARKILGVAVAEGAYEAKHENRATITDKIAKLTDEEEPWSGYDEQSVDAITSTLADSTPPNTAQRSAPTSTTTPLLRQPAAA